MKKWLLFILLSVVSAQASEWKLERDRDGIQVYTRRVKGIAFKEYKGVVHIKASLSTVIAVFEDLTSATEWIDSYSEMKLIERVSPTQAYTYAYIPAPWPVRDRDAVVFSTLSQDPATKTVTIIQKAIPNKTPLRKKAVRVKRIDGHWTLVPKADGTIELTYQLLSDPGGGLPAWLVNLVAVSQPFDTLTGLRKVAQSGKYKEATFSFITEVAQPILK